MDLPAPGVPIHPLAPGRVPLGLLVVLVIISRPISAATTDSLTGNGSIAKVLPCDRQALQARIDLIGRSQHTIDVAYYSLKADEVGLAILEHLRRAAQRGVRVRVLIDGVKWRLGAAGHGYLTSQGIEFALYHPLGPRGPKWLNQRLHSKLMLFDDEIAIIGSRNLENGHFGIDQNHNFADCDVVASGPVAIAAKRYFDRLWRSDQVRPPPKRGSLAALLVNSSSFDDSECERGWRRSVTCVEFQRLLDRAVEHVTTCLGVSDRSDADWIRCAVCDANLFLLTDCRLDKSARIFQQRVIQLMNSANSRIVIESPYPAFDKPLRAAISRARKRGVCVTIITNSLNNSDVPATYAAYQNQKRSLLKEGVHLREYCGARTLHAKTMLVDESIWMIGSHNFDARSNRSNLELAVISSDPTGAQQLKTDIQTRVRNTTLIDPQGLILQVGGKAPLAKRATLIMNRVMVEAYRCLL